MYADIPGKFFAGAAIMPDVRPSTVACDGLAVGTKVLRARNGPFTFTWRSVNTTGKKSQVIQVHRILNGIPPCSSTTPPYQSASMTRAWKCNPQRALEHPRHQSKLQPLGESFLV